MPVRHLVQNKNKYLGTIGDVGILVDFAKTILLARWINCN